MHAPQQVGRDGSAAPAGGGQSMAGGFPPSQRGPGESQGRKLPRSTGAPSGLRGGVAATPAHVPPVESAPLRGSREAAAVSGRAGRGAACTGAKIAQSAQWDFLLVQVGPRAAPREPKGRVALQLSGLPSLGSSPPTGPVRIFPKHTSKVREASSEHTPDHFVRHSLPPVWCLGHKPAAFIRLQ